jgi:hypothetical protein
VRSRLLVALLGLALVVLAGSASVALAETSEQTLSRRPFAPLDHSLLNGPNGIGRIVLYPDASPMSPATGSPLTEQQAGTQLDRYLAEEYPASAPARAAARAVFDNATAKSKVPDPGPRAALAALRGSIADAAVDFVLSGTPTVNSIGFVAPAQGCGSQSPGWAGCSFIASLGQIQLNSRYQYENPFLFSHLLAHEVLHSDGSVADYEETTAYVLDTRLYIEQLARHPWLATLGTEFARRSNSNAIARLNSGTGSQLGLYATNGNGQIFPGSTADKSTNWFADFASSVTTTTPGGPVLGPYLSATHTAGAPACSPASFSKALIDCLDANRNLGLSSDELVAAARALKLNLSPPSTGGGGGGGGGAVDRKPPSQKLSGKQAQKLGGAIAVTVTCGEACTATATGTLRAGKSYPLKRASKTLRAHRPLTLKLKLSAKARKAAKRALKRHKKVSAKLKIVVKDKAGNKASKTRTVKLKR